MIRRRARALVVAALLPASAGCATEIAGALARDALACMPAVTVGTPGAIPMVSQLPTDQPVSAMLVWPKRVAPKAASTATAAGATVVGTYSAHRALGVRATGAQLTRLQQELPGAELFLASVGTSELCVAR